MRHHLARKTTLATITLALIGGMFASNADAAARKNAAPPTFEQRQVQAKQSIWVSKLAIKTKFIGREDAE